MVNRFRSRIAVVLLPMVLVQTELFRLLMLLRIGVLAAAYNYASTDNGVGLYAGNGTPYANHSPSNGVTNLSWL